MLTMLLLAIGLIMLLSASSYAALYDKAAGYKVVDGVVQLGDALYYFKHQLAYAVGGVVVMWLVSRVDYQRWRLWSLPVLAVAVVLLLLVLTPLGVNVNGATRWLRLLLVVGPTYQPSEVAKLGVVLVFATGMSKRNATMPQLSRAYASVEGECQCISLLERPGGDGALSHHSGDHLRPDVGGTSHVRYQFWSWRRERRFSLPQVYGWAGLPSAVWPLASWVQ